MSPIDVLGATKQRLLEKGWTTGIGRCLYSTIEAVVVDDVLWYGAARPQATAMEALRLVVGDRSLVAWNVRQTSVAPVIAAIDEAIRQLAGASQ